MTDPETATPETAEKSVVKRVQSKVELVAQYPPPPSEITRRSFLLSWAGLAWTTFSIASTVGVLATARFMYARSWGQLMEPVLKFPVGPLSDFALGVDERFKQSRGVWLVRTEKELFCLITVCTHLGCTPNWLLSEDKFKCPCHGSGFRMSGINFEGPAPRPLERAKIWQDATSGLVMVDKSKTFHYEKGEWTDKNAYIDLAV